MPGWSEPVIGVGNHNTLRHLVQFSLNLEKLKVDSPNLTQFISSLLIFVFPVGLTINDIYVSLM
jgi:hypothetical protein